jgi:autotransporter-associated beta strand protein
MHRKSLRHLSHALLAAALVTCHARAGDNTWTGATNSSWSSSANNWSLNPFFWDNLFIDAAIFAGDAPGTITVDSPITLRAIGFNANGYTINGPNTLTFANGGSGSYSVGELRVSPGVSATINATIAGAVPLTKTGTGTLTLGGNNTYTGKITVSAGTLSISDGSNLGQLPGSFTADHLRMAAGTTLQWTASGALGANRGLQLDGPATIDTAGSGSSLNLRGAVSGTGSLTKIGSGTLILTANNTYSGGLTTISAGTLQIGNGGTTGSITGNIANNAALAFNRSDNLTYTGDISGSGSLTKLDTGTLTLTGINSYSGNTTISAGTLLAAGSLSLPGFNTPGKVTVADGATLAVRANNLSNGWTPFSIESLITLSTFNTPNSRFAIDTSQGDFSYGPNLTASLSFVKQGANTLVLTGNLSPVGGTTISAGTLQIGNGGTTGSISGNITNNASIVFRSDFPNIYSGSISGTGSLTKQGTGSLTLTGSNTFSGGTTISAGILIVGNAGTTGSFSGNITNNSVLHFNRSDDITYSGDISGNGNLIKSGPGTLTLTGNMTGTGPSISFISAGTLQIGNGGTTGSITSNITNNANLAFNRSDNLTYSGVISGNGSLTKLGAGTLTLTGSRTDIGLTIISDGTLNLGSANAIGSLGTLTFTGGTLQYSAANTTDYSSRIANNTGAISIDTNNQNVTFASAIAASNTGGLTKLGTGTLTLTGSNSYSGVTTISAGTLQIGSGGTTGSIAGNITNNSSLAFNRSDNLTYSGDISGNGSLIKLGTETLTLTGSNTFSGNTTISAGTLQIGNGDDTGSIAGNIANNAFLVFNRSNDLTYSGDISGTGLLTKRGAGTLILAGSRTGVGLTIISAGTLQIGNGGFSGNISGNIVNNAALAFNRSDDLTYSGVISGNGSLTKLGAGTLTLMGNKTGTGLTTISAGTLQIGDGGTTGSVAGNITNNASLVFNRLDDLTYSGVISGNGSLTKLGSGTLTLAGSRTGVGLTIISAGTLNLGSANAIGSTSALTFTGGTLQYSAANTTDYSLVIANSTGPISIDTNSRNVTFASPIAASNTGGLTKLGAGTLTLSGSNNYSGTTTISAGTLQIGSAGTTGSIAGNITNNASLVFNRLDDLTYSGSISGTGSLTKTGAGTLTLTGINSFAGIKNIEGGVLSVNSTDNLGSFPLTFVPDHIRFANGGTLRWTGSSSGLNINRGLQLDGIGVIDISSATTNLNISGVVSGTGSLNKTGAGTLTLTGSNTYTGGTNVFAGTLNVGSTNAIGSTGTLGFFGGTLQYSAANTFDYSSRIANSTGPISIDTNSQNVAFASSIAASNIGGLDKRGLGTLTLTGSNTYTGGTNILAGTLNVGSTNAIGSTGALGFFGGTLQYSAANTFDYSSRIANSTGPISIDTNSQNVTFASPIAASNSGGLTKLGSGTLTLSASNNYAGTTIVSAGTLQIGNGGNTGSISGSITNNASLVFNRSDDVVYASLVSGSGTLIQQGAGTLTLTSFNTFTGGTVISNGVVSFSGLENLGATPISFVPNHVTFDNGGTLRWDGGTRTFTSRSGLFLAGNGNIEVTSPSANLLVASVVSGPGSLTKTGPGDLILYGENTYTGGTLVSAGRLQIGAVTTTGSLQGNISLLNGAIVLFGRTNDFTFPGDITGNGSFVSYPPSNVTQSFTGNIHISDGVGAAGGGRVLIDSSVTSGYLAVFQPQSSLELAPGGDNTLVTSELSFEFPSNKVITNDNDLIVNYTGVSNIAGLINYFNSGQLIPSGDLAGLPTTLAISEAADLGLTEFNGIAVDDTTVIAKYTYVGDANLDGQVDALDYERIDLAIGNSGVFGTAQGDLNYDGNVDALDYEQVDLNIGNGVGSPLAAVFIPEPTLLAPIALLPLLTARRRR